MRWAKRCAIGLATTLTVIAAVIYGPCQWYTAQRRIAAVETLREVAKPYGSEVFTEETPQPPPDSTTDPNNGADTEALTLLRELKASYDERTSSDPEGSEALFDYFLGGDSLSSEELTKLGNFVSHTQDIVTGAKRLASMARPSLESQELQPNSEHLSTAYRWLMFLLYADAGVNKQRGMASDAVADILAGHQFWKASIESKSVCDKPLYLYRSFALRRVFELVDNVGLDQVPLEQILELEAQLPTTYGRDRFQNHLATAARLTTDSYEDLRNTTSAQRFLEAGREFRDADPSVTGVNRFLGMLEDRFYVSPLGAPIRDMQEQSYANAMARIIEVASLSYYQAVNNRETFDQSIGVIRGKYGRYRASELLADQANREATLDLLRIGLALERYRKQAGQYPASLGDVATLLSAPLPVDPYTGSSYIYRPHDDSLLLYSVGYNGEDDGGVYDLTKGDIVWHGGTAQP